MNKQQFVSRILDGVAPMPKKTSNAKSPASFSADDVFGNDDATAPAVPPPADSRFAQLLLEEVFAHGEAQPRDEIVLGDQRTSKFLPKAGIYWPKTAERSFHIVLFELDMKGRELLADPFFRQTDQLEDALHRILQDVLDGFEKKRTASARQGAQSETLCVVSIVDDRNSSGRQLVCFGTKSTTTGTLEVFTLREEVRDWDRPLAEEHLDQLFSRHFDKLASGAKWQDAFITGAERKKIRELITSCTQASLLGIGEEELRIKLRDVLDEIAGSFGIHRKSANQNRRLDMIELPMNHGIGADPAESQKPGFKNPLQGVRIYDRAERLLGFIVYVASTKAKVESLHAALTTNNHFHNVLVIYPDSAEPELELWQGSTPLRGRLTRGPKRTQFDGEGGVVQLLSRFFIVSKSAIEKPKQLATELAWRAQHLKALAVEELEKEIKSGNDAGPLKKLFDTFNTALATLTVEQFADAYAQTITYGMLAARWLSSSEQSLLFTRKNLPELLPSTSAFLHDLFQKLVNSNFDKNISWLLDDITSLLARTSVSQVFQDEKRDPSIHFYEDFLDAYDPQVRKDQGVYYTPDEVVSYIVRTVHASLQNDFGLPLGLADTTTWEAFAKAKNLEVPEGVDLKAPFVQVLDPALGTGTFLLRVIEVIHETRQAEFKRQGLDETAAKKAWVTYVRKDLLPRINGFELMMAPYIVSHLRLGLALQETGFTFMKNDRLRVFLTNTLEMHTSPQLSFIGEHVAEESKEAERVKKQLAISVIVGNPPYEREPAETAGNHKGGWVRSGWDGWRGGRPLLEDFAEPTRNAGRGGDLKNIYNLYVYFWRWAMWRVFDRHKAPGVVSFITAASYLRGPGFSGMREEMRRAADRVFIFDLEGDHLGARKTENVFNITIAVCVGSMVLATAPNRTACAAGSYKRITGTREQKLKAADAPRKFGDVSWSGAPSGWLDVLMAGGSASYDAWPTLIDLLPWTHTGAEFQRAWPIGETKEVLARRWSAFLSSGDRAAMFSENRDRKVDETYKPLFAEERLQRALDKEPRNASPPRVERYGFRSFQRFWCFADSRIGTVLKPVLWNCLSANQVFITGNLAGVLGDGPAATATADVPDKHYFCGRGGKDVIPLWRDAEGRKANISVSFVAALKTAYAKAPSPEDIFAYTYAVLANPGYVKRYEEELQVPGPRLPVTKDKALFERGVALGRELLRWHTYGERFREKGDKFKLTGSAKVTTSIPLAPAKYPEKHKYDDKRQVLRVGDGEIAHVSPEVWSFSVSGLQVVKSWLDYRMKKGAGKKSSPLDDIRPERWTDEMTRELLELIWALEHSLATYPALDAWLDQVLAGALFTGDEIPKPTEAERKEPKVKRSPELFEDDDE